MHDPGDEHREKVEEPRPEGERASKAFDERVKQLVEQGWQVTRVHPKRESAD